MLDKVNRELNVVLEEGQKIRKASSSMELFSQNLDPYLKTTTYMKNLSSSFLQNFIEMLTQSQILKVTEQYKFVIDDLTKKMKDLDFFYKERYQKKEVEQIKQYCYICAENIHENNIKHVKNILEHNPRKEFNQMLNQCKKLSEERMWTEDENAEYERKLYQNLSQKQKILNMYSREIQQFTSLIDSSISELTAIKQIKVKEIEKNSQETRYVNMGKIGQDVSKFLKSSFEHKIPPWIHKMFTKMVKFYLASLKNKQKQEGTQTVDESEDEQNGFIKENQSLKNLLKDLKQQYEQHMNYTEKLKSLIKEKALGDLNAIKTPRMKSSTSMLVFLTSMINKKSLFANNSKDDVKQSSESECDDEYWQKGVKNYLENRKIRSKRAIKKRRSLKIDEEEVEGLQKKNYQDSIKQIDEDEIDNLSERSSKIKNENPSNLEMTQSQKEIKERIKEIQNLSREERSNRAITQNNEQKTFRNSSYLQKSRKDIKQVGKSQKKEKLKKLNMTQISKVNGNQTQQTSLHEGLQNEKKIAREVSDILKKNRENKNILFPKLNDNKQRLDKTEKKSSLKKELKNKMRLTDRIDQVKKAKFQSKQKDNRQQSVSPQIVKTEETKEMFFSNQKPKSISINNEDKVYSILKQNHLLPENLSFLQFKALVREEKIKESDPQYPQNRQNSVYSFISSIDAEEKEITFRDEDFHLFFTPKIAYRYEESFAKNYHKRNLITMNSKQAEACCLIYEQMENLKKNDKKKYNKICSLLRYPYQTLYCNFSVLTFVSDMNDSTFSLYFRKLIGLHRHCKSKKDICQHIYEFFKSNIE